MRVRGGGKGGRSMISITRRGPRTDGRKTQARRNNQTILKNFLLPPFFFACFPKGGKIRQIDCIYIYFPGSKMPNNGLLCAVSCMQQIHFAERARERRDCYKIDK